MNDIEALPINTRVMAPLGDVLYRGIIVEPPADHPPAEGMVWIKFTPPVTAEKPYDSIDTIVYPADRVTPGWF
jgi:hypothetical protein